MLQFGPAGNVYVSGTSLDAVLNVAGTTLTQVGGCTWTYTAKLSSETGEIQWITQIGGTATGLEDPVNDIVVDANGVYVMGFQRTPTLTVGKWLTVALNT